MKLTINNKPFTRFQIIELEFWGNEAEGYEVNNIFETGVYLTLQEAKTDKQVISEIKRLGLVKRNVRHTSIALDFDLEDRIYVTDAKTDRPWFYLQEG